MESDSGVRILSPEKLFSPRRNIKSELESRIQESQETDPLDETNIKVSYMIRKDLKDKCPRARSMHRRSIGSNIQESQYLICLIL